MMPTAHIHPEAPGIESAKLLASRKYCRRVARAHRENFVVGSCLLPRDIRQHFYNLYTFCRTADDFADQTDSPTESLRRLDWWQSHLDQCYQGQATHIAFVALQDTIRRFAIPQTPFNDLLSAFRRDQFQHRYANVDELLDYCRLSANPVGHLVLYVADCFDPRRAQLADHICTALQLIDHWQDVGSDFQRGRIYVPRDAMQRWGVDETMFSGTQTPEALAALLSEQGDLAEQLLARGRTLLDEVPKWLRIDLGLIIAGGDAAIENLRRSRYDVLANRCSVAKTTQIKLLIRAIYQRWRS